MCGISGYVGYRPPAEDLLHETLSLMIQRGPDIQAFNRFFINGCHYIFMASRLKIIDLSEEGNQPFFLKDHVLIFNGEIYNYKELRKKLEHKGETCITRSDTEVLLRMLQKYGEDAFAYLEGMWAFALLNIKTGECTLSRDRFGEKPLYYLQAEEGIYFSSETSCIRKLSGDRTLNENYSKSFLVYGFRSLFQSDETFFSSIRRFPPACHAAIVDAKVTQFEPYWQPHFSVDMDMTLDEAISGTRERLIRSLEFRLRADVPLAFCLSGGVDSASLAAIAKRELGYEVHAYSIIDPDPRYNEEERILGLVRDLGITSTRITLKKGDFLQRLKSLVRYHDAPVSTISYYVHSLLSEKMSSDRCRVAISGTAADELFAGYYDHFLLHISHLRGEERRHAIENWNAYVSPMVRNPELQDPERYVRNPDNRDHLFLNKQEFQGILRGEISWNHHEADYSSDLFRNRMLMELFKEIVPVILHEDDLNSMYYSIENRSPFLDRELVEWSFRIPSKYLVQNGYSKYILREAVKGILPDEIRLHREKIGFNASITSLLDLSDLATREHILEDSQIYDFIDREFVLKLLARGEYPNSYNKLLFSFLGLKYFLEGISD
jgi:asparagine synthase (glutamine-hydrolysing)